MKVIDDFLTEDECDFLIDYYKKYRDKETYNATLILRMKDTSLFNLRKSWIRYRYLKRIKKEFCLKLNYDQIVFWPPSSFKDMHKDGLIDKNNDWTGYTENYNKVILNNSKKDLGNKISKIKIIGISSDFNHCIAELV